MILTAAALASLARNPHTFHTRPFLVSPLPPALLVLLGFRKLRASRLLQVFYRGRVLQCNRGALRPRVVPLVALPLRVGITSLLVRIGLSLPLLCLLESHLNRTLRGTYALHAERNGHIQRRKVCLVHSDQLVGGSQWCYLEFQSEIAAIGPIDGHIGKRKDAVDERRQTLHS